MQTINDLISINWKKVFQTGRTSVSAAIDAIATMCAMAEMTKAGQTKGNRARRSCGCQVLDLDPVFS